MSEAVWKLDPAHTEITFRVRHMMVANVTGRFDKYDLEIDTDGDDFHKARSVVFTADTASVNTGSEQRDAHLKSADFFDSEKYPQLKFVMTRIEHTGSGEHYTVYGDLTIKDKTNQVKLEVDYGGLMKDPWGNTKAGFSVQTKINRKDWDLNWNAALETGGVLVSDEVRINCEVQLVKQQG